MSILFCIFVVLINNIMQSKEIITAPIADAITPSGVVDKPSACGAFIPPTMKMIEDLGYQYLNPTNKQKSHIAIFECPYCKRQFKTRVSDVERNAISSCGCKTIEFRVSHRKCHKMSTSRLYRIWAAVKQRATNHNIPNHRRYVDRGITICNEWLKFEPFMEWALVNGYSEKLTIDRINNDGNYEPSNCRWVTKHENDLNRDFSKYKYAQERENHKWRVRLCRNKRIVFQGHFNSKEEAISAKNEFLKNYNN